MLLTRPASDVFGRSGYPCTECHLWICKCDHQPVPQIADQAEPVAADQPPERTPEDAEADVRVLMAKHAAIMARGWQTAKDREILHQRIDRLLDEHRYLTMVAAVAP